jgi:hypothetical protein
VLHGLLAPASLALILRKTLPRNPVATRNVDSGKLVDASRRMVVETRLLIDRLRPRDGNDKVLHAIGRAQRQLRRSQLCLRRIERVLSANPGLFGVCDRVRANAAVDLAYRRFMDRLCATSTDTSDDCS